MEHQRATTRFPTIEPADGLSRKIGAGEGNRTLVISLEGPKRLHDIKANSDISVRFGPLRGNRNFPLSERGHCTALPPTTARHLNAKRPLGDFGTAPPSGRKGRGATTTSIPDDPDTLLSRDLAAIMLRAAGYPGRLRRNAAAAVRARRPHPAAQFLERR